MGVWHGPVLLVLAFITELTRAWYVMAAGHGRVWTATIYGTLCTVFTFVAMWVCVNRIDGLVWYVIGDSVGTYLAVRYGKGLLKGG